MPDDDLQEAFRKCLDEYLDEAGDWESIDTDDLADNLIAVLRNTK